MSYTFIPTRFQWRMDTAANWAANNPIPLQGEPCLETDTGRFKIGDGVTAWNALGYQGIWTLDDIRRALDLLGSTATGDIIYKGAAGWTRLAKGTNGQVLTLTNGLPAWENPAGGGSAGTVPLAADFTTFGTGITVADKSDRMQLSVTSFAVTEMRGIVQNGIAPPYTIDAHISHIGTPDTSAGQETGAGICLSDGTKYVQFTLGMLGSVAASRIANWTTNTSFSAVAKGNAVTLVGGDFYIRITDDGVTRKYWLSGNGKDYFEFFSQPTNTFLVPSKFGLIVYNKAAGAAVSKTTITNWTIADSVLGDAA